MNKLEPLQTLLKIYKDKHSCLLHYLPKETTEKLVKWSGDAFVDSKITEGTNVHIVGYVRVHSCKQECTSDPT